MDIGYDRQAAEGGVSAVYLLMGLSPWRKASSIYWSPALRHRCAIGIRQFGLNGSPMAVQPIAGLQRSNPGRLASQPDSTVGARLT